MEIVRTLKKKNEKTNITDRKITNSSKNAIVGRQIIISTKMIASTTSSRPAGLRRIKFTLRGRRGRRTAAGGTRQDPRSTRLGDIVATNRYTNM